MKDPKGEYYRAEVKRLEEEFRAFREAYRNLVSRGDTSAIMIHTNPISETKQVYWLAGKFIKLERTLPKTGDVIYVGDVF